MDGKWRYEKSDVSIRRGWGSEGEGLFFSETDASDFYPARKTLIQN